MAKGVIDADGILNRARPWVHQQAHEIQPFGHLVKLPIRAGGERVQGKRGQSQPAAGRYDHAARPCTRSTTGEWQDRRFVNCMWLEVPHPHSARHAVRVAQRGHGRSHVDGCARQATPAATRNDPEAHQRDDQCCGTRAIGDAFETICSAPRSSLYAWGSVVRLT